MEHDFAEVGPWAKDKLEALSRYLDYYGKVLKHTRWRTIYLDAYAGGGRAVVRVGETEEPPPDLFFTPPLDTSQRELIDGSPRVALNVANPFSRYVFVEPSPKRFAELEALKAEYGVGRTVYLIRGTAREGIDWVTSRGIGRSTHRGVAFLDPFGADLEWASVQKLADTGLFEVFVNFTLNMAIVRMMPNAGKVQETWARKLDALFGDRSWHDEAYERKAGLFSDGGLSKRHDYVERLLGLYSGKLKAAFGLVSTPRLVRNTKGAPLYYLLWAGSHAKGLQGAEYVLKMGESVKGNRRAAARIDRLTPP